MTFLEGNPILATMQNQSTDLLELAARFVNSTASNIFLTGKAGTGKTTFLRDLARKTHKRFVIVAPTGIAALNAQGVTIHSQFLFPLGSFVPDQDFNLPPGEHSSFYTQKTLAQKHPLNSIRKQVLRACDLLIIDEVSMLRADLLDAIDYRLKRVKGNYHRSFGGVQVLMIGDLYQLPPIVKDHEWNVLRNYYRSMHFFEAQALKRDGMVYIELDKIFRQQDDTFINILNNLRNNIATKADIDVLNNYYKPQDQIEQEGVVTITTHNYKADKINQDELDALPGSEFLFEAEVDGDFPESMYPLPQTIALKEGAQVMFIKNDSSGGSEYYNGKLATVDSIDENEITVLMGDTQTPFVLRKERWENKRYTVAEDSKELEEEVVGSFVQYPVKLAWAVTVHKSQGLTFEKAIIDVGQAFAPGQVYVALSRLRSLDGLTLRTKISPSVISSDAEVVTFSQEKNQKEELPKYLLSGQRDYLVRLLLSTFDFTPIVQQLAYFTKDQGSMEFEDETMRAALPELISRLENERGNTEKFQQQLQYYLHHNQHDVLLERIQKGSAYYIDFMRENLRKLYTHLAEVERFSRTVQYRNALAEVDQLFMKALGDIEKSAYIAECVLSGKEIIRKKDEDEQRTFWRKRRLEEARAKALEDTRLAKATKSGRKRKKGEPKLKQPKGSTFKTTYMLINEGMSLKEVAETRGLALSTIEGHAVRGIRDGELKLEKVLPQPLINIITEAFREHKNLNKVFGHFESKISYDTLRMVQAGLDES